MHASHDGHPAERLSVSAAVSTSRLIFISAAEPSADRHGAELVHTVRATDPEVRFVGVAGPRMVEAGCESIFDMTSHSSMLLSAIWNVGRGARMLNTAEEYLRMHHVDAAVLIDSPTLHLPLAGRARSAGVPVLYYIAPQMWAWGAHRIYKLRHRVDKVACILPFEEEYFRNQGVDARFVGHPLAQQVAQHKLDEKVIAEMRGGNSPYIALLSGSRKHVVNSVLPGQLEIAAKIAAGFPDASFGISVANPQVEPVIRTALANQISARGLSVSEPRDSSREFTNPNPDLQRWANQNRARKEAKIHPSEFRIKTLAASDELRFNTYTDHLPELISAADLVLVASGTTALEVAFYARPMIVMYQSSPLFYHAVGRWMIKTPHLSLPNILASRSSEPFIRTPSVSRKSASGERGICGANQNPDTAPRGERARIVPEFMPYYASTEPIARCALELLKNASMRERMIADLKQVTQPLRGMNAAKNVGEMLREMMG